MPTVEKTGQPVPQTDGALVRCVLESLAMRYRQVYQSLKPYITWEEKLYIVGGGAQNQVLNQFAANALGIPVITGASEATAVGNVMEQLYALGAYKTRAEKCDILAASFETAHVSAAGYRRVGTKLTVVLMTYNEHRN